MTGVTMIIIDAFLGACGSAIFAGLCVWVRGLYKKSKIFDQALKALAVDAYFRCCKELLPQKDISKVELENFNILYASYHSLGLNSTGDKMYKEITAKPIRLEEGN